ncbi:hypothetical protein GCM10010975_03510 [Comamonas phosphati]|nr:hypothetical protein GCM10010975_03510 [Comamonas phosphati]
MKVRAILYILLVATCSFAHGACKPGDEIENRLAQKETVFANVRAAAFQGNAECQLLLASMYGYGIGTEQSQKAALRWHFISALTLGKPAYGGLLQLFGTSGSQNTYDPVLVYALIYSGGGEKYREALEYWEKKMASSFEREEARRIGVLLEKG